MSLAERTKGLSPKDIEDVLSQVWSEFKGTEAHEALEILFTYIYNQAFTSLTGAGVSDSVRAHAAGIIWAIEVLRGTIGRILHRPAIESPSEPIPISQDSFEENLFPPGEPDFVEYRSRRP